MAHVSLAECLLHAQSLTDSGCVQQAVAFLQGHRKRFAMDGSFNALLGSLLGSQEDFAGAVACLELARRGGVARADVMLNLGVCLTKLGKFEQAEKVLREGMERYKGERFFGRQLVLTLRLAGRVCDGAAEAATQWRAAPEDADAIQLAFDESIDAVEPDATIALMREMEKWPRLAAATGQCLSLQMLYSDKVAPQEVFGTQVKAGLALQRIVPAIAKAFENSREPERRLRIAYCSQDFRNRSAGHFIEGIIAAHDRERFEVFCYHNTISEDVLTERLKTHAAGWRDVRKMNDVEAAQSARADGIDVWVDLTGWTGMGRVGICAARAAPVQATYMGYAGSTGLETIDARFVDALTDPPGVAEAWASERLLRLSPCFLGYSPPSHLPEVVMEPAVRDVARAVTLGSFNTYSKITPTCLDQWCGVLRAMPDSRMVVKNFHLQHGQLRERLMQGFVARGVDAARVELRAETMGVYEHLAAYGGIDIALDSYPYHGTTTTIEALMMGVPVLGVAGQMHHSRVGVSLMHAIGEPGWSVGSADELVARVVELAQDRERLTALRGTLRGRMLHSAICDVAGATRQLEGHYRALWREWCAKTGA
jgi:predicted O-linked N-acetylglucosamine transferase (SPINDLY family)